MEQNKLIGVWIDSKRAVISGLQGDDSSLDVLTSGIEGNERIEGEGRPEGRFGGQFVDNEQADEARRKDDERDFVAQVVERVGPSWKPVAVIDDDASVTVPLGLAACDDFLVAATVYGSGPLISRPIE